MTAAVALQRRATLSTLRSKESEKGRCSDLIM
ncbi:hypothetical protein Y888_02460 [Mixta calida B021323]|nr:hypothetical protein Y888_02460 [Mixta calida B021323]